MNNPAASSGVSKTLPIDDLNAIYCIPDLNFNIPTYHLFVTMLTNRASKIAISPKLTTP